MTIDQRERKENKFRKDFIAALEQIGFKNVFHQTYTSEDGCSINVATVSNLAEALEALRIIGTRQTSNAIKRILKI